MKNRQGIPVRELKGFRKPTAEEQRKICHFMDPVLRQRRKQMNVFRTVIACFSAAMTASAVHKLLYGVEQSTQIITEVVITAVFWGIFIAVHKSIYTNKLLDQRIRNGQYQVLDCLSYEHHYHQDQNRTEGSVKIQTREGVLCEGNFVVDIETALLSEDGKILPLLLLYEQESNESRVFSEKMLNGG